MQGHVPTPTFGTKSPDDRIKQLMDESERNLKDLSIKKVLDTQPLSEERTLQGNVQFQEMLRDLEAFDLLSAPNKYDQAFYSSLRTMMRECIFTKNHNLRKAHIERVYTWFRKKRSSAPQANPPQPPKPPQSTSPRPPMTDEEREMRRRRHLSRLGIGRNDIPFADDDASAAADGERPLTDPFDVRGKPPVAWAAPRASSAGRLTEYKLRNLRVAQLRRQGVPAAALRAAEAAARRAEERDVQESRATEALDRVERAAQELWARKRRCPYRCLTESSSRTHPACTIMHLHAHLWARKRRCPRARARVPRVSRASARVARACSRGVRARARDCARVRAR